MRRLLLVLGTLPRLLKARSNFSVGYDRSGRVTLDPAIAMSRPVPARSRALTTK
jgi:hypothetical protein